MFSKRDKNTDRVRRHKRVRKHLSGSMECPRLCVYRSNMSIYAQIIDDVNGNTLACASSTDKDFDMAGKTKTEQARLVGEKVAKIALEKGIKTVVLTVVVIFTQDVFRLLPMAQEVLDLSFRRNQWQN